MKRLTATASLAFLAATLALSACGGSDDSKASKSDSCPLGTSYDKKEQACVSPFDKSETSRPTTGQSETPVTQLSKDSLFVLAVKADSDVIDSLDISAVTDAQLVQASHQICAELSAIPQPTFTDLDPIIARDIVPLLTGAHNFRAPRDNGPAVLAYALATPAVRDFCPDKASALNE